MAVLVRKFYSSLYGFLRIYLRFISNKDDFTFIVIRGRSAVDYLCVPHAVFASCSKFRLIPCQDIIDSYRLLRLLGIRSRIPDHAFLLTELKFPVLTNQ